jgi:hypothetical protein
MSAALHTVEIDSDAELATLEKLAAEADAKENVAAEADAAAEHDAAGHDPEAWRAATDFVTQVLAGQLCPGWHLQASDCAELSTALAAVLDHYWPGGPHGIENWHPLYRLAFVGATITVTRGVDWSTGRVRPMRIERETEKNGESEAAGRPASVPSGPDAEREKRSGFSMGGEA